MRFVSFSLRGESHWGALVGNRVIDLQMAYLYMRADLMACGAGAQHELSQAQRELAQTEMPTDGLRFISLGSCAFKLAQRTVEFVKSKGLPKVAPSGAGLCYPLDEVRLLPPIERPGKIIAIGLNYSDHAAESNMPLPQNPVFFAKFSTCLVGPGAPIEHPGHLTSQLDYEVELAIIIGRKGKRIPEELAMDYVYGYSIMNDISARNLQFEDSQWMKGKALDTFAPFGPAIVTADEIGDPHTLDIKLTLNGETMQNSNTRHMVFSIPKIISYLSQLVTLEPGDVISTGTPAGIGHGRKPPVYLQPGDVVSAAVQGVGVLVNPVVAAEPV